MMPRREPAGLHWVVRQDFTRTGLGTETLNARRSQLCEDLGTVSGLEQMQVQGPGKGRSMVSYKTYKGLWCW